MAHVVLYSFADYAGIKIVLGGLLGLAGFFFLGPVGGALGVLAVLFYDF